MFRELFSTMQLNKPYLALIIIHIFCFVSLLLDISLFRIIILYIKNTLLLIL
jgi:hypothetical protein